ncbi:MAG: PocR ligand-binding domain-containing protein [Peptostreptococcaceae bacterium]
MDSFFKIENLIEVDVLQNIQDNFAKATGIGAVTVDYKGEPITEESGFSGFCGKTRQNSELKNKCNKCDALGGVQSAITGKPHIYKCHMGLVDFAIPIIVHNTYVGAILAGQIRVEENVNLEEIIKPTAWSDESLVEEYSKIEVKSYDEVEAAANLMYQMANYIVEKTFLNNMKKELNHKTEKLKEESEIRSELEKSLREEKEKKNKDEISPKVSNRRVYSVEIEKAIEYIENNIKRPITLDDVASHINLSTHYLSKLFKKEMDVNFITYLTERRIEIAKEMLLDPNIPIVNIAVDLSYNQPNYFSKVFKKTVGLTPTEYRDKFVI